MTPDVRPTRRDVLRGGALASLGLAGCLNRAAQPEAPDPPTGDAVRWTHWTGGSVRHRPTVSDGVVYVAGGANDRATNPDEHVRPERSETVFALDAADGAEQWRYEAPAGITSEPIVRDGVYAVVGWAGPNGSGRDQRLVRIEDGEPTWTSAREDRNRRLLAVGEDAAYVGTLDDAVGTGGEELIAIDTDDGTERWSVEAGDVLGATLRGDSLYVDEGSRRTTAIDAGDGSERWHRDASPVDQPRPYGDVLFVQGAQNDAGNYPVVAVDAGDGSERWEFVVPVDEPFVPTGAVVADDVVYVTEYGGWLFALDAADGTELWRYEASGDTPDPPVVAGGRVYLAARDGSVHCVDAATGEQRWTEAPGVRPRIAAANGSGVVAFGGGEEAETYLRAYAPDGTERWSFSTAEGIESPSVRGTRAYVATDGGHVLALDEP